MEDLLRLSVKASSIIAHFLDSWERGTFSNQLPRGLKWNVVQCRASAVLWQWRLGEDVWISTSAETWIFHRHSPLQVKWTGRELCLLIWIACVWAYTQPVWWPQVTHSISEEAKRLSFLGQILGSMPAYLMPVTGLYITKPCMYSMYVMLGWGYALYETQILDLLYHGFCSKHAHALVTEPSYSVCQHTTLLICPVCVCATLPRISLNMQQSKSKDDRRICFFCMTLWPTCLYKMGVKEIHTITYTGIRKYIPFTKMFMHTIYTKGKMKTSCAGLPWKNKSLQHQNNHEYLTYHMKDQYFDQELFAKCSTGAYQSLC